MAVGSSRGTGPPARRASKSVTAAELEDAGLTSQHKGPAQAPAAAAGTGREAGASCGAVAARSQQAGTTQVSASAQSGSCPVAGGETGIRKAATPAAGSSPASAAETLPAAAALWDAQPHRQLLDGSTAALEERPHQQPPHSSAGGPAALWIRSEQDGQPDAAAAVTLQGQAAVCPQGLLRSLSSRCGSDRSTGTDEADVEAEIQDELDAAYEAEDDAGNGSSGEAPEGECDHMQLAVSELQP